MKFLFCIGLLAILVSGCSYRGFYIKERDSRNAYIQRPLIIPSNLDLNLHSYTNLTQEPNYIDEVIYQLLFDENINIYKQKVKIVPIDEKDKLFLQILQTNEQIDNIRELLNNEYLNITRKNNRFINKILHWQTNESLLVPSKEYLHIK